MASVITLTGASGCGKTEIIRIFKENKENEQNSFKPMVIPKFTTRPFRHYELEMVSHQMGNTLDVRPVVGVDNVVRDKNGEALPEEQQEYERLKMFSKLGCDIVYEQYGNRYGLYSSEIFDSLKIVDTLCFGIETSDFAAINNIANILYNEPFRQYGEPRNIAEKYFGGKNGLLDAMSDLQRELYV